MGWGGRGLGRGLGCGLGCGLGRGYSVGMRGWGVGGAWGVGVFREEGTFFTNARTSFIYYTSFFLFQE